MSETETEEFTTEDIKYTISAKEFFRVITGIQEQIDERFYESHDEMSSLNQVYRKVEERLAEIEHILRKIKESR